MGERTVDEVMDKLEEQADGRLKLLHVVDTAPMMHVTREAILDWIEEERQRERAVFGAVARGSSRVEMLP